MTDIENWTYRKRPARFERRVEFDSYALTSEFLEMTGELSEKLDYYPDMNFGKTHVNMTIHLDEGCEELNDAQARYVEQLNNIAPDNKFKPPLDQ